MMDRRFIEESFPVKELGQVSASEKSARHGSISTLHIWWARRPLAASRGTAFAALTPAPAGIDEWKHGRDFIVDLSRWKNSLNQRLLEQARQVVLEANGQQRLRVLDPFAGGGSFPLEALRLGCETYASDYNPVAVIILKAVLEYPQRFGRSVSGRSVSLNAADDNSANHLFTDAHGGERIVNPLVDAVRHWGRWVLVETQKELADVHPVDPDGAIPVSYIWARTIPCQNPTCAIEIPLLRQFWLAKKDTKRIAIYPECRNSNVEFRIVGDGYDNWPQDFTPDRGTISDAIAVCPCCGTIIDAKTTRRLVLEGRSGQRMVAVVTYHPRLKRKKYRIATARDEANYNRAVLLLADKRDRLLGEWGLDPIPDEQITRERPSPNARGVSGVTRYGLYTWGDLYNTRQKLGLVTFVEKVRLLAGQILIDGSGPDFATAVTTYLALVIDKMADFATVLCRWGNDDEGITATFSRQALQMVWDYAESNPLGPITGSWLWGLELVLAVIEHLSTVKASPAVVGQATAEHLPYSDAYFDAILTDPPYYDNVPYSHLADFFYVWLKRSVGHLHPELFSTPLTPKSGEIVAYTLPEGGFEAGETFFEEHLRLAFKEISRVLKPEGIAVIVYAHKSTKGWEKVINALTDSGLVITGAWPLRTEMRTRLNAKETAALASSIYIVARKMTRLSVGFYNEVRDELRHHLDTKLQRLWEEGISGADFFIAAIGSAIEVFGKYEQVLDYEGNVVRADRLLEDVRTIATDYAVHQILHDGFAGEISDLTRFYVLWRWEYGEARVPFDEARKLAQSCGLDISREWGRGGFIKKDKEFIQALGPQARKIEGLETSHEMIDVLHRVLLLWEKGQRAAMVTTLASSGYGASEAFYRVAQAISETLPNESKEKKLLDGFLAGRGRVRDDVEQIVHRPTLWQE